MKSELSDVRSGQDSPTNPGAHDIVYFVGSLRPFRRVCGVGRKDRVGCDRQTRRMLSYTRFGWRFGNILHQIFLDMLEALVANGTRCSHTPRVRFR